MSPLVQLNLPSIQSDLIKSTVHQIFDVVRKKWLELTPEEWVRQHFIHYLNQDLGYPLSLMGVEKKLTLNGLTKRTDIVCYNSKGKAILLIECKAPSVPLNQNVFDQIARYNMKLGIENMVLTNGLQHIAFSANKEHNSYQFQKTIPPYSDLN